jgi:hypothetical protein
MRQIENENFAKEQKRDIARHYFAHAQMSRSNQ